MQWKALVPHLIQKHLIPERSVNRAGLIPVGELTSSGRGPASPRLLNPASGLTDQRNVNLVGWLLACWLVLLTSGDSAPMISSVLRVPGLTFPVLDVSYLVYTQGASILQFKELSIVAQRGGFGYRRDLRAALAIFLLVIASTLPPSLPFSAGPSTRRIPP